jgi:hypothetical protein
MYTICPISESPLAVYQEWGKERQENQDCLWLLSQKNEGIKVKI